MIFAAGLGTRLRPLTDNMPKALVSVAGKTMLERVILKLKDAGFHDITINIHHFGSQIIDFLRANQNFGVDIHISDERGELLDTGGGIKKARPLLESNEPFLIHNADILTDLDLNAFYHHHLESDADATLLTNHRKTSRYLLMNQDNRLVVGRIFLQAKYSPKNSIIPAIIISCKLLVASMFFLPLFSVIWKMNAGQGNFPLFRFMWISARKHAFKDFL